MKKELKKDLEDQIKNFFKTRPALSVAMIEKEANIPPTSLAHFLGGGRGIPSHNLVPLLPILKKYGFQEKNG